MRARNNSVAFGRAMENCLIAGEFMRIFYANRDKLNDPDKIKAGESLKIPV